MQRPSMELRHRRSSAAQMLPAQLPGLGAGAYLEYSLRYPI